MSGTAPRSPMARREVIALTLAGGATAYVAAKVQHDASWHTPDINRAKVFRHPMMAQAKINSHGGYPGMNPRIIDPRGVDGYEDKPTRAAKKLAARYARVAALVAEGESIARTNPRGES